MNGKRYVYITPDDYETAEKNGISRHTVYQRVHTCGWDIDRAITEPVNFRFRTSSIWGHWKDKAVVDYETFRKRLQKLRWSAEKAALTPVMTKKESCSLAREVRHCKRF